MKENIFLRGKSTLLWRELSFNEKEHLTMKENIFLRGKNIFRNWECINMFLYERKEHISMKESMFLGGKNIIRHGDIKKVHVKNHELRAHLSK